MPSERSFFCVCSGPKFTSVIIFFQALHPEYFATDSRVELRYLIEHSKGCDIAKDCRYLNKDERLPLEKRVVLDSK